MTNQLAWEAALLNKVTLFNVFISYNPISVREVSYSSTPIAICLINDAHTFWASVSLKILGSHAFVNGFWLYSFSLYQPIIVCRGKDPGDSSVAARNTLDRGVGFLQSTGFPLLALCPQWDNTRDKGTFYFMLLFRSSLQGKLHLTSRRKDTTTSCI